MTNAKDGNKTPEKEDIIALEKIEEYYRRRSFLARQSLDDIYNNKNSLPSLRCKMGANISYISCAPLKWLADAGFASDLKLFDSCMDEQDNNAPLEILDKMKLDWSQQVDLTLYLALRKNKIFPSVLLIAYQDWVFNPDDDNWYYGQAICESVTCESLDSHSNIVILKDNDTNFYALGGQHRLMAIKGLRDLLEGGLCPKNKDGSVAENKVVSINKILETHPDKESLNENVLRQKLNSILCREQIGIEIIPAVQMGETIEKSYARLRQVLLDVQ